MKIRPATEKDLQEIKALLYLTWKDTYKNIMPDEVIEKITSEWHSIENMKIQLEDPKVVFFIAEENRIISGVLTAQLIMDREYYLKRLYVLPDKQKNGIGKKLLNAFVTLTDVSKLTLEVESENLKGLSFYKKEGFVNMGNRVEIIGKFYIKTLVMEKVFN